MSDWRIESGGGGRKKELRRRTEKEERGTRDDARSARTEKRRVKEDGDGDETKRDETGRGEGERERERERAKEDDREQRMRKEERNRRSNVANVRSVCLERRRLHQPSDRATRSCSPHFYYRFRAVPTRVASPPTDKTTTWNSRVERVSAENIYIYLLYLTLCRAFRDG